MSRSGNLKSSVPQESAGDDNAGLGGNLLSRGVPGGAGLRRDDSESMAVSSCGVVVYVCVRVSRKTGTLVLLL